MKVIGTAGHVDHGKTTLVHRLTGIDTDRLSEEKRRGMTIDLGFAWLTLPSGEKVSIIDVPGHERFVKNMLAGSSGVDTALLVIAADEGVMPQTREHLAILDLLGVASGVVALTKRDLVDVEWLRLVEDDVQQLLKGTALESSTMIPVSASSGEGIDALLAQLDIALSRSSARAPGAGYIPVDRVFSISGFGTVITGTIHGDEFAVGEELEIVPRGKRVRIRNMQSHGLSVAVVDPGSRAALNLSGVDTQGIGRGDILARPGAVAAVVTLDARLRVLADVSAALKHGTRLSVHIGSADREATVVILGKERLEPGESGWVQLRFDSPVGAVRGQRFILRLPSPVRTVGGGEVVDVAPRHRRFDPRAPESLARLQSSSMETAVVAAFRKHPREAHEIASLLGANRSEVDSALEALVEQDSLVRLGKHYVSADVWQQVQRRAGEVLAAYHQENPLRDGMPKEELRSRLGWGDEVWPATVNRLARFGVLEERGPSISSPDHLGGTQGRLAEVQRILGVLMEHPFSPPAVADVLATARSDAHVLEAMAAEGKIIRLSDTLSVAREAYDAMVGQTLEVLRRDGEVTVATLRDVLDTSRKYVVSFLEHLDGEQVTRRVGDVRVLGRRAPA